VALTGTSGSSFATVSHNQHRLRRSALNPFFSKMAVTKLEPLIQEKVDKLAARFEKAMKTGEVIRIDAAYTALTMDVICQYSFAMDDNMLGEPDFKLAWKETLTGATEGGAMLRQFPWMFPMMNALPEKWLATMQPGMKLMLDWRAGVLRRAKPILDRTETAEDFKNASHRSIFHDLRDSSLPPHEKTVDRLCDEGQVLTGAGSETTAWTLAVVTFYLLHDKAIFEKLKEELKTVVVTPRSTVRWAVVERLPFLVHSSLIKHFPGRFKS
jgi:cytochrome P450